MILRDERPDLRWGDREVIALLFDMNALFEAYVAEALRGIPGLRVRTQAKRRFWHPDAGPARIVQPDLLVYAPGATRPLVVDTKWKLPADDRPDDADLRQVFAYLHACDGDRALLLYPCARTNQRGSEGWFLGGTLRGGTGFVELFSAEGRPDLGAVRGALPGVLGLGGLGGAVGVGGVATAAH